MTVDRRFILSAPLALTVAARPAAAAQRVFTPEAFGAKGDGRSNDSEAMRRLAQAVNAAGGGTIAFRRTTYLVGQQRRSTARDGYLFEPTPLLDLSGCTGPLTIRGNGARLQAARGLRYGIFNADGSPRRRTMPNYDRAGQSTPYVAMIEIAGCTGPVHVADIELAGAVGSLLQGGQYGDTGWQIAGSGLVLRDNRGAERIERVRSHHHPLDGFIIDGVDAAAQVARTFVDCHADANGRQGCSLVGGHGYRFSRCSFTRTGKAGLQSSPGAGFDIEAEGTKRIRDLRFDGCRFADNAGVGLVADSGDSADVAATDCTFVGTTSWSAWPRKPRMRFDRCTFVGAMCNAFGSADPGQAAQFRDCRFDNDPARSPTRTVYQGANASGPIADLSSERNVLFERCRFTALHGGVLPWSTSVIYRDCTMEAGMAAEGYPRGTFEGTNRITGKVDLTGSRFRGPVILNGRPIG